MRVIISYYYDNHAFRLISTRNKIFLLLLLIIHAVRLGAETKRARKARQMSGNLNGFAR